jgi:cytochrome c
MKDGKDGKVGKHGKVGGQGDIPWETVILSEAKDLLGMLTGVILAMTLAACQRSSAMTPAHAAQVTGGNPARGAEAIRQYGCATCHTVAGVPGARGTVGPELSGLSGKPYIAGVLTNTPANLIRWIHHPQQIDPLTAMPDVGLTEPAARDIASYLYTR